MKLTNNRRVMVIGTLLLASAIHAAARPTWVLNFLNTSLNLGRTGHSAVFDPATKSMIVFGGAVGTTSVAATNDVLQLTAEGNWRVLVKNGAAGSPPQRWTHTAVYDSANNRMIIFGGFSFQAGSVFLNDVWVLVHANGQGGTRAWTQLAPSGPSPDPRWGHNAVYDAANNRMVIFGGGRGGQDAFPEFNDLWALSNANGVTGTPTWTRLLPAGTIPGRRGGHTAVYDPVTNQMLMFAGDSAEAKFFTVWTLTDANGL